MGSCQLGLCTDRCFCTDVLDRGLQAQSVVLLCCGPAAVAPVLCPRLLVLDAYSCL